MMAVKKIAPRLHVLLARESARAVVIRRGPSKPFCTIGWDRERDEFALGQWFKGRIYERRCDLSPDGRHLIYFAMNGRWDSETRGSWTAISRAPYLKALGLWAKGDCWHGGGMFIDGRSFWINDGYGHDVMENPKGLVRVEHVDGENAHGGECPGVYYLRLQRDGWTLRKERSVSPCDMTIFEKPLKGGWTLRKVAHATGYHPPGKGCYYDEHALQPPEQSDALDHKNWEWADADDGRLYWCTEGKLFAARLLGSGPEFDDAIELRDFNAMKFEAAAAPY